MSSFKDYLKNAWNKVRDFLNGDDHDHGVFHLNEEEVASLRENYNVVQQFTMLVNKYGGGAVMVPTQQYKVTHKDYSALTEEDILHVERFLQTIRNEKLTPSNNPSLNK